MVDGIGRTTCYKPNRTEGEDIIMSNQVLQVLYQQYPGIIKQMPQRFTSHEFILELARQYQTSYIEALYEYRNSPNPNNPSPFQILHGQLANYLHHCLQVRHVGQQNSTDIFGNSNTCAVWEKV